MRYNGIDYVYLKDRTQDDFDEEVLRYISGHPGCGKRDVRKAGLGDNNRVDKALDNLIAQGRIVNKGNAQKCEYMAVLPSPLKPVKPQQAASTPKHRDQHTLEDFEDDDSWLMEDFEDDDSWFLDDSEDDDSWFLDDSEDDDPWFLDDSEDDDPWVVN